jgi:hypothetical protein
MRNGLTNRVGNANDNVAATQLQGHDGVLVECATCHGANAFTVTDFVGKFDANGLMKGPHGMHPVNDPDWNLHHSVVFQDFRTPAGTCQACHGAALQGSSLARVAVNRTLVCDDTSRPGCVDTAIGPRIVLPKGTQVDCTTCHENPTLGD